jgi:hypothetical protein
MKYLIYRRFLIILLALSVMVPVCEAQRYKKSLRNPERYLFGKSLNNKNTKVRESPSIVRAKKKQAENQKKNKKEYDEFVKDSRKRAFKIQSPDVQARMVENKKESDLKYKEKRKKMAENSRKTGRKYK